MPWRVLRMTIMLAAILAAWTVAMDDSHQACAWDRHRTSPALFPNYYVPPGPDGYVGARLYVAPLPTPPLVGHTYVTYGPLMPHEFLYRHCRTYWRYNPQGGWTRTSVIWR